MPALIPVDRSAAAPALDTMPAAPVDEAAGSPPGGGPPRQAPLFDDRPKIIPFPRERTRGGGGGRRRPPGRRDSGAGQTPLDLRPPARLEKKAVIDDAPVAPAPARIQAAMLDLGIVGLGIAGAALAFHLMGGQFQWSAKAAAPCVGAVLAAATFYHLFWALLGRETTGMRCFGLRTLTFDGHPPGWGRRTFRFGVYCLGMVAVGVGLLWALVDDEALTMHDHLSKTFPTPFDPHPSTLRRR